MVPSAYPSGDEPLRPPCYAVIRGPFGRAGYQVATVARDDDFVRKIVLVFSCPEKAQRYAESAPQGHQDWKVGPLPSWRRLRFFLDAVQDTAQFVTVDFDRATEPDGQYAHRISELLGELEARAREEAGGK